MATICQLAALSTLAQVEGKPSVLDITQSLPGAIKVAAPEGGGHDAVAFTETDFFNRAGGLAVQAARLRTSFVAKYAAVTDDHCADALKRWVLGARGQGGARQTAHRPSHKPGRSRRGRLCHNPLSPPPPPPTPHTHTHTHSAEGTTT